MLSRRDDELPVEAIRDLLGVARAMAATGAYDERRLQHAVRDLGAALELAAAAGPGTVGRRAAWSRAERGSETIGQLVRLTHDAHAIVVAAQQRILRR